MSPLSRFFSQPWHIQPAAIESLLLRLVEMESARHPLSDEVEPLDARPSHDCMGDPLAQMELLSSGLAIVPVHGPLVLGATGSDKKYYGVASHEDISADLDEAINQGAESILLDMNSPGGTVAGTPELAQKIDDLSAQVDIFSYNGQLCASAAEYLSAGVTARFGVGSSINGSIGTMLETVDISKLLERFGVTVNLFTSGKYKATGHLAKALTDDQREFLTTFVKNHGAEFAAHMQAHRPSLTAEHMQGQIFTGREAASIGLLDQLVSSRAEAIALIT